MVAVPSHLLILHTPAYGFQKDLLHVLLGREVKLTGPAFPSSSSLPFLKVGVMFPFFQSSGTFPITMTVQR